MAHRPISKAQIVAILLVLFLVCAVATLCGLLLGYDAAFAWLALVGVPSEWPFAAFWSAYGSDVL